jgi:hypothetical protein
VDPSGGGRRLRGRVGLRGLGPRRLAARAAEDRRCPEKDIKVTSREMGTSDASGCGKHLSYVVRSGEVLPDSGGDDGVGE